MDKNCTEATNFSYETVVKEELIIEDNELSEVTEASEQSKTDQQLSPALADHQETSRESTDSSTFVFETVVKEEIIEDELVPPEDVESKDNSSATEDEYFCKECNKPFSNWPSFRVHKRKHKILESGKFTCKLCDRRFKDKYGLTVHQQSIHSTTRLVKPLKKGRNGSSGEPNVKLFPKTVTDENGQFKCTECDERFQFKFQQQRHIKRHVILKQELYKCEDCNKAFVTQQEFTSHMKRAHEKHAHKSSEVTAIEEEGIFRCSKCNRKFEERHMCQRHILRHLALLKGKDFPCQKCDKIFQKFSSQVFLDKHQVRHEPKPVIESEPIKCDHCNRTFKTQRLMARHKNRQLALKEGKFQCSICSERYSSKAVLMSHEEKHKKMLENQDERPPPIVVERNDHTAFKCPECAMLFNFKRSYYSHAKRHINIRNGTFKCNICDKVCASNANLATHLRRHKTGEIKDCQPAVVDRPFECTKCDKKFAKKHLLKKHTKMHEAFEKGTFQCMDCLKYLGSIGSLEQHQRGHCKGRSKDFKCPECDLTVQHRTTLIKHLRVKHGKNEQQ